MDNTKGQFEPISIEKFNEQMQQLQPLVFKVGEILEIRGSRLRIEKIKNNKVIIKLLPHLPNSDIEALRKSLIQGKGIDNNH